MGTTKSRKSRRNNSRPTAFTFLSNIALGSENEKPPDDAIHRLSSVYTEQNTCHYVQDKQTHIGGNDMTSIGARVHFFFKKKPLY
jgi:hypothetical protein